MDRFGPSEDCPVCSHPQSYGHFAKCPVCGRTMCDWCMEHGHDCEDVYANAERERELVDYDCPDCLGTGIGYSHEPNSCGWCNGRGYLLPEEDYEQGDLE